MYAIRHKPGLALIALLVCASGGAAAEQFIGFGQAGKPGWAVQAYPWLSRDGAGGRSIGAHNVLAWFSQRGLPGTQGDQFEVWAGLPAGYAARHGHGGWGTGSPQLGAMYYHNAIRSNAAPGSDDYLTYWVSPLVMLNFPNGRTGPGFGAGANHYGIGLSVSNYLQAGKFAISANPLSIYYAGPERHHIATAPGRHTRYRGGLSVTLMDMAAGYQVHPDLFLGLHHAYHIYGLRHASGPTLRQGQLGPAFTYTGWLRHGVLFAANLNFSYYASAGMPRSATLAAVLSKSF